MVYGESVFINTKGFSDIVNITDYVQNTVKQSLIKNGIINVCVIGSTASISTMEYEPALINDTKELLEKLISSKIPSRHSQTWGDDNGFSHMRSTLLGTSACFPLVNGVLRLGTWQQIVLIDHDNRSRKREVHIQLIGE